MTQAQLAALAAGNPRVAERMRAGHYNDRIAAQNDQQPVRPAEETAPAVAETHASTPAAGDTNPSGAAPATREPAPAPAGELAGRKVTDADVLDEDGNLSLVLWLDGADEEQPTVAIPIAEEAAFVLGDAIDKAFRVDEILETEPSSPAGAADGPVEFDVATLQARDLDDGYWAGPVEMILTGDDGREVVARFSELQMAQLKRLLTPGFFGRTKSIAVDADGQELAEHERAWHSETE